MHASITRRGLLIGAAGGAALSTLAHEAAAAPRRVARRPVMVGSENALPGMKAQLAALVAGGHPLDAAVEVCKVAEADPADTSVGLGGLPNEDGVVQLDAACMDATTHNSGAVGALEDTLHAIEVARLVMERTDHCQIFGEGATRFARSHGHPHVDLLTEGSRQAWVRWKETLSDQDDRLPPPAKDTKQGWVPGRFERHGTIHCSVLAADGRLACATSTSGLAYKIPGRVGDSAIVGAGLYCSAEIGSAGSTGRGEASILSCGSATVVELLRGGRTPKDAGMEVLRRIVANTKRSASWQAALIGPDGQPAFDIQFYIVSFDGSYAGVTLKGKTHARFSVAEPDGGARHETLEALLT
jgi:N4-(beta-N-acetylglucosaminyl)-L-asparaginase